MNSLSKLDALLATYLLPLRSKTATRSANGTATTDIASSSSSSINGNVHAPSIPSSSSSYPNHASPTPHPRLSNLPPQPRKRRGRRPKPTMSSIKLPPPTTPLLLRIVLALWSILLSLWTSLVVETRAERVKRRRRRPAVTRNGSDDVGEEAEAEAEGSASEIEGAISGDDDGQGWEDPVTRQQPDEKVDTPDDDEFVVPPHLEVERQRARDSDYKSRSSNRTPPEDRPVSFRLRSAGNSDPSRPPSPTTPSNIPKTFVTQPTPPSILSNPLRSSTPSPQLEEKARLKNEIQDNQSLRTPEEKPKPTTGRLLPNPISTAVLDPTVPAVPASGTFTTAVSNARSPQSRRPTTTPFHLRKTLILDLDETLIHSTSRPMSYSASAGGGMLGFGGLFGGGKRREGHAVEVILRGRSTMYHVYKRPHVDYFLKKVRFPPLITFLPLGVLTTGRAVVHPHHLHRLNARIRRSSDRLAGRRPRPVRKEILSGKLPPPPQRIVYQGSDDCRAGSK